MYWCPDCNQTVESEIVGTEIACVRCGSVELEAVTHDEEMEEL